MKSLKRDIIERAAKEISKDLDRIVSDDDEIVIVPKEKISEFITSIQESLIQNIKDDDDLFNTLLSLNSLMIADLIGYTVDIMEETTNDLKSFKVN